MRYIGSKARVLDFIEAFILEKVQDIEGKVFADLFSGTAVVGAYFKGKGCKVISNDYLAFSYALQIAMIKLNEVPQFKGLQKSGLHSYVDVIEYLNESETLKGFFYDNYTMGGTKGKTFNRNYFLEDNAMKIDGMLNHLREWKKRGDISFEEDMLLKASIIDSAISVSNISGTYGAFLKTDDRRKFKPIKLKVLNIQESTASHSCYNQDIFELLPQIKGDILYLDPPYNQRQYPPYYHILESITLNDTPYIYGKTGRRVYKDKLSAFCLKNEASKAIEDTIKNANFKHIFLSYNSEGLVSKKEMEKILGRYGSVDVSLVKQRRYKSNSNGKGYNNLKELLFYVRKES